jgi:hypothetical protein
MMKVSKLRFPPETTVTRNIRCMAGYGVLNEKTEARDFESKKRGGYG